MPFSEAIPEYSAQSFIEIRRMYVSKAVQSMGQQNSHDNALCQCQQLGKAYWLP